jgi:hypothetical protein
VFSRGRFKEIWIRGAEVGPCAEHINPPALRAWHSSVSERHLRKSKVNLRLLASCALLAASGAQAVPTSTDIGTVNVLGTVYNVSLLYDSEGDRYNQSFSYLNPSITFNTQESAFAAATALFTTFGNDFDWTPASDDPLNGTRVAYYAGGNYYEMVIVRGYGDFTDGVAGPLESSLISGNYFSFAQFVAAPVPEPETYALMLAGLALVGAAARRRQAK